MEVNGEKREKDFHFFKDAKSLKLGISFKNKRLLKIYYLACDLLSIHLSIIYLRHKEINLERIKK